MTDVQVVLRSFGIPLVLFVTVPLLCQRHGGRMSWEFEEIQTKYVYRSMIKRSQDRAINSNSLCLVLAAA